MSGVSRVETDSWKSENYGLPSALYFYYMNSGLLEWNSEEFSAVLGNCPTIQSVHFTPFLKPTDMDISMVEYDVYRFGKLEDIRPTLTYTPFVYRINSLENNVKTLGTFKPHNITGTTIGGKWNWRNESRLYNYPFMYGMLTDNLNQPLEVIYHLCPSKSLATVKVRNTISDKCSYGIFIDGYKGDTNGRLECLVSGDGHELPCSSSAYSQWVATSKNQTAQNIQNMTYNATLNNQNIQQNAMLSGISSVFSGVASAVQGNIGGVFNSATGLASNIINSEFNQKMNKIGVQQAIQNNLAKQSDLKTTPPTMVSMGSNPYYGMDKGECKVMLYRFGMRYSYYEKIGFYLHRFGYAQNKHLAFPRETLRNRYYFNYIKTTGANIKLGEGIPRSIHEQLRTIYDNGVTIWHMDRNGVEMHNYENDNYEV